MFLLLIAGILIGFSAPSGIPPSGFQPLPCLLGTLVLTGVGALSGLVIRRAAPPPPLATPEEHLGWARRTARRRWLARGLLIGTYTYTVHGLGWPVFVSWLLGPKGTVALDEVLVLTPFLISLLGALVIGFPGERRLSGRAWSLGGYLLFVLRQYWAFLLVPWLIYVVVLDLMETVMLPGLPPGLESGVKWAVVLALMVSLYAFWPLALRWLWPTRRLPDGPLRSRLERMCRRAGVRYREILIWRTPVGGLANAAVAGLAGPLRYILLTDTLLERLEPEEVEAVLGHELAHVLRRHIPYYVLFAGGFIALALLADIVLGGGLPEPTLSAGPEASLGDLAAAAVVVGLYWGVLFGWLSRRFEREADLVAAQLVGDAEPFARALEKIAFINGRPPERPGWRHFSVARRVRFLREAALNPAAAERALAQAALLRRALIAGSTAALAAVAVSAALLG